MTQERHQAPLAEGAGYKLPGPRNPAHEPIDWWETDYDDQFEDPDTEFVDPLPTERHRSVPGMN
jgi:hypothetical protein